MRHPNVVLFMGACTADPSKLAIVTELVSAGSLYTIIHKHWRSLKFEWLLRAVSDIAVGMAYLHSRSPPIVHRDLKPMNILVDGTPIWMAPEVLRNEPYTEKVDVYSFALVEAVGRKALRPRLPDSVPESVKDLIHKCWSQNPQLRPTFKDVIALPVFSS
eukprot:m51a1_g9998 putative map3k delta-1 protein isoform 2 (160) ;mRNA; r:61180-61928